MKILLFSVFIALATLACKKENRWDCIKSTGDMAVEIRMLQPFDTLRVYDNIKTFIDIDSAQMITVKAGKHLLPLIKTGVISNELIIRNLNSCNWVRSYEKGEITVTVSTPGIIKIVNYSAAPVASIDTLQNYIIWLSAENSGDIELLLNTIFSYGEMHASGDIILHGKSVVNGVWLAGSGWLRCSDLKTDYTFIESHSSGDCLVNVSKSIGAAIYSTGNIRYTGDPFAIEARQYSTGKLVNDN